MSFEIKAKSWEGIAFAEAAQSLIPGFRERAAAADRENSMCKENFEALAKTGIAAAFVPQSLGGLGLESVHDWLSGIATLARGDGSTAIAINMHLGVSRGMALAYNQALTQGRTTDKWKTTLL